MTDVKKTETAERMDVQKKENDLAKQEAAETRPVRRTYSDKNTRVTEIKDKNHAVTIMVSSSNPEELDGMMLEAEKSVLGEKDYAALTQGSKTADNRGSDVKAESKNSAVTKDEHTDSALKCMDDFSNIEDIRKQMASFTESIDKEMDNMMPRFMRQTLNLSRAMDALLSSGRFWGI